jgi:hypothetical protein
MRWLIALVRRRFARSSQARADVPGRVVDLDIVLSEINPDALEAHPPASTDYDVHSLGDPIDPVTTNYAPARGRR